MRASYAAPIARAWTRSAGAVVERKHGVPALGLVDEHVAAADAGVDAALRIEVRDDADRAVDGHRHLGGMRLHERIARLAGLLGAAAPLGVLEDLRPRMGRALGV